MYLSRDKFGARITLEKPVWYGGYEGYWLRQSGREMPVPNLLDRLEIGECVEITGFQTKGVIMEELEEIKQEYADYRTKTERLIDNAQKAIVDGLSLAGFFLGCSTPETNNTNDSNHIR